MSTCLIATVLKLPNFRHLTRRRLCSIPCPTISRLVTSRSAGTTRCRPLDKQFVGTLYPFAPKLENELTIGAPSLAASIGAFGEIDTYNFAVKQAGKIRAETEGSIDTIMSLFGPNNSTKFIAQDDDSGGRLQARIVATLQPGVYTLRVRHFSNKKMGSYKIGVYPA